MTLSMKSFFRTFATTALVFLCIALGAQEKKPIIYALGDSFITHTLRNAEMEGASATELAGMRLGMEARLAEAPLTATFLPDKTLLFSNSDQALPFEVEGQDLMVSSPLIGAYICFGTFSADWKTLTLLNGTILDRIQ